MPWPCLLSSIAVGVAPLRNLTGDADLKNLLDAFTDDLAADLTRHGRGFSLQPLAKKRANSAQRPESDLKYFVTGSAQRGSPGALRINVRIADAATSEYLWARRFEFGADEAVSVQAKIIRRIFRELHILLLQQEVGGVVCELGAGHELNECLSSAATALEGELRPDLTAEAQRWYLAALADDPRNVEALVGLARTCQELVSNPWWGDPLAASVASDLGREVVAIALNLAPGAADAHCVQGMLYSAAGKLEEAALAFERALAMGWGFGNRPRFRRLQCCLSRQRRRYAAGDRTCDASRPSRPAAQDLAFLWQLCRIADRAHRGVDALLQKSLQRNRSYGSARMFLIAALSLSGQYREAADAAASFRQQYPDGPRGSVRAASSYGCRVRDPQPTGPRSFRYSRQFAVSGWEPDPRTHSLKKR